MQSLAAKIMLAITQAITLSSHSQIKEFFAVIKLVPRIIDLPYTAYKPWQMVLLRDL
jgi:hypothetical protein